jgi:chromosome segregation ATPase
MRPVVFDPTTASTGAFVSVPDTREHEDLARRVAELEGIFGNFSTGYKAFESTYRAQTAQMAEFNTRLAAVEQKCERMAGEIKLLTDKVAGMDRADMRAETLLSNMQSGMDRLRAEIRRIEQMCKDKGVDTERYEPKGFQQNDQPARFMGGGRM